MGEIGIQRHEFLYDIRFWEVRRIIRGYRRRQRSGWEQARLNAFYIMSAMADLSKAGIRSDRDLITFPWEKDVANRDSLPTDEEVEEMRQKMKQLNEQQTTKNERP